MDQAVLKAILAIGRRADAVEAATLQESFTGVGNIDLRLSSPDHQIVFERRGTGKTHTLKYMLSTPANKTVPLYVDLRSIGSNGSVYGDQSMALNQRATTLLIDFLGSLHDQLLDYFVQSEDADLSVAGPHLDRLANAVTGTRVEGPVSVIEKSTQEYGTKTEIKASFSEKPSVSTGFASDSHQKADAELKYDVVRASHVVFGDLNAPLRALAGLAPGGQFVLFVDEWSDIPLELQPLLADFIRKAVIASGIVLKIAAIEHRSNFAVASTGGHYVGVQLGADVMADINLDDFMVFENDESKSVQFFRNMLHRHCLSHLDEENQKRYKNEDTFILEIFTERRAFAEFVRATEGVPRDALNLLHKAAIKAADRKVGVDDVRDAAREWYQSDKASFINQDPETRRLLNWIIDKVIRGRKARAFLFDSDRREELIDRLFDARVLHILKKNISSKEGGQRFDAYKLDYGCYVDLMKTNANPESLLGDGLDNFDEFEVEVPDDDYRAIRRAILDFDEFLSEREPFVHSGGGAAIAAPAPQATRT